MKKILVTTDFSPNSKEAIRFAIKMAIHDTYELTCYHVYHLLRPTIWNEHTFHSFEKRESAKIKRKLTRFVEAVGKEIGAMPDKIQFAVANASSVGNSILDYATHHHFDFICLSTNGESKFKRITGNIASQLIKKSDIPLITVPANHKTDKLRSVLCATDLSNLGEEVKLSVELAKSIHAELGILHLQGPEDFNLDPGLTSQMIKKISDYPTELYFRNSDLAKPLAENIQMAIEDISPSMLILFTDQTKNLVEKLLFPSFTKAYMFKSGIPLIIFKK